MDLMPAERKTPRPSEHQSLGGTRSVLSPAYLGAPYGLSKPRPQRPPLFKRAGATGKSSPPPRRLAPIPSPATGLSEQDRSASNSAPGASDFNSFSDEDNILRDLWAAASGEPNASHRALAVTISSYESPLPLVGAGGLVSCATSRSSAPPSTRVGSLQRRKMCLSGTQYPHAAHGCGHAASEGTSADEAVCSPEEAPSSWSITQTTAATPCTQGVASRQRNVTSQAEHTATSISRSFPGDRSVQSLRGVAAESSAQREIALEQQLADTLKTCVVQSPLDEDAQAGQGSPPCSRSGENAMSSGASSIDVTARDARIHGHAVTLQAGHRVLESTTAAQQCIVFEDSVDTGAVVTPAQLQQMREEAAQGNDQEGELVELATPYQNRLITAEVLRDWTGWEDLDLVYATQFRLDAEFMIGVDQIGGHLPRLASLKLNCSRIPRVRQLGTGFHALKYLWMNSCHLVDLRGIAACCPSLVEIYLPFNHVRDLSPVMALCATLEVLDVEGNLLADAVELGSVLTSLYKVRSLSIVGNPLTCRYQGRVREAYRALIVKEEGSVECDNTATINDTATSASLPTDQKPFSHVLASWVRLLMPQLQILDDVAIDTMIAASPCASSQVHSSPSERAEQRYAAAVSFHVDPLDDAVAEELRLLEECLRNTDAFDPLLAAVDEANKHVYTRPSTSCSGARPRLAPKTAMGVARPSTSQWTTAPGRLCSWGITPTEASALTTGVSLAGNTTASLRRRAPEPSTQALDRANVALSHTPASSAPSAEVRGTSTRLSDIPNRDQKYCASAISSSTASVDETARISALLADDSEEEEWERFKSSLIRSQSATAAAATPSYSELLHSQYEEAADAADTLQADDFDKELLTELTRLRIRIAKEHRE